MKMTQFIYGQTGKNRTLTQSQKSLLLFKQNKATQEWPMKFSVCMILPGNESWACLPIVHCRVKGSDMREVLTKNFIGLAIHFMFLLRNASCLQLCVNHP